MFRVLFLILLVIGPAAFAQTVGKLEANKIDEFEREVDDNISDRIQNFYNRINDIANAQGYIINYGTDRSISNREITIRKIIADFKFDPGQITIVKGGYRKVVKTEFWI